MPRQHELPHAAGKPGPCDAARDAWQDAAEAASDAAADKKRKLAELLDLMQETGTARVPITDRKTGKRKWLEITADPKLRTVKADSEPENGRHLPQERAEPDPAGTDTPIAPGAAGELVEGDDPDGDLRTPGQQRRKVRR